MAKKLAAKAAPTQPPAGEKRAFRMHDRLLLDVIKRQAGTLHKAVLEGVMNAVDAKAPEIHITLTDRQLVITDNGGGIDSKDAIYQVWETFGQPPTEDEKTKKTYGYFRMGRGQLFAFGRNKWETGKFSMLCDIENEGLNYELIEDDEIHTHGCHIVIDLYTPLNPSAIAQMERELEVSIKYVPAIVTFNDRQLTVPIGKVNWDHETDDAYIKLKDTGNLVVFNLGVLVESHPQYKFGCGGEVVSKRQLKVNFARNEVMSDCPIWKRVKPIVDQRARAKITRQPVLNDGARQRIADEMLTGDANRAAAASAKIITDVTGRNWSISQLFHSVWQDTITTAPQGERRGDRLMQHKLAFVVGQTTLDRFRVESLEELMEVLHRYDDGVGLANFAVTPFELAASDISSRHDLLPEKEWKTNEDFVIHVLRDNVYFLYRYLQEQRGVKHAEYNHHRRIKLGLSDSADGWTDGETYIALNREYISRVGFRNGAWTQYAMLLIHELCHDESDLNSHVHSPEFYENYHEWTHHACVGEFVRYCLARIPQIAKAVQKRIPAMQLKQQDHVVLADRATEGLEKSIQEASPPPLAARAVPRRRRT